MTENTNFWHALKKPIIVLAPMADVTDAAFRRAIAKYGKPDVTWTEFVSADGLAFADARGREALMQDLMYTEAERPIVAQFFTSRPDSMEKAAELAAELGFDGIDINMGCPDKGVERQGAGAAMIKNPKRAREVIRAAKRGAANAAARGVNGGKLLPVTVKTRVGFNKDELDTWLPELLAEEPAVVTIHARTRKEMSKVPARWEDVKRGVEIRNRVQGIDQKTGERTDGGVKTLIFGNGDVMSVAEAYEKARVTGADGVMLGRAIFGNPWLFSGRDPQSISIQEKLQVMVEHTKLFQELLGRGKVGENGVVENRPHAKNFAIMKKHYKAYVNGWDGAKELRMQLMETETAEQVEEIITNYLKTLG